MADNLPVAPPPPIIVAPGVAGVAYNDPPQSILPAIKKHLEHATADLEPGSVALVGVADRQGGWNAAVVAKTKGDLQAELFIGKKWGTDERLDFGVRVLKVWKLE